MIRVQQVRVPLKHTAEDIRKKACKMLRIREQDVTDYRIVKQSIDARKQDVFYIYTVDIAVDGEEKLLARVHTPNIAKAKEIIYKLPVQGTEQMQHRPVIIGSGPAGLFAAYILAVCGYQPIVMERGRTVEERTADVENFWATGVLKPESNVQFGEGGAGAFSDGKLNTLVKDVAGRNRYVLELFVKMGAPAEICYMNKPHIGTDILRTVVANLRKEIIRLGGSFRFETKLTGLSLTDNSLNGIHFDSMENTSGETLAADIMVLAIGHSARDTFEMLSKTAIHMEAKAFAVGMRVEHPQQMIDECQYHGKGREHLPAAAYKLTANLENGRGVYSFCMCPGGYVVNASSEEKRLAVNGMSYHARDGHNANSAIIVSVTPEDYKGQDALAGVAFQRELEQKAYQLGNGRIPQQLFGDFEKNRISTKYGAYRSETKGETSFANLREIFPETISESFIEGMHLFARKIPEYDRADAILSGVESRTSSPVRITRDDKFESNIGGIYPCGEGAGYAGGIMSAAMDGMKVAEAIVKRYAPHFHTTQEETE